MRESQYVRQSKTATLAPRRRRLTALPCFRSTCQGPGKHSAWSDLVEKQKEGKKRMKNIGQVEVPQEAFVSALRLED